MEEVCNTDLLDVPSKVGDRFVELVTEKLEEILGCSTSCPYYMIE